MNINEKLKKYIDEYIFPSYFKNDDGHNLEHIKYVIKRSLKFAEKIQDINYDMVYTIAAYHDLGHHIDAKNHEKVSAEILLNDANLKEYFNEQQIKDMYEAVYDHRASLEYEPRSIYGKIVSSADRNTTVDVMIKRTYEYRIRHNLNYTLREIINESREHIMEKFGKNGYANKKMYFEDEEFNKFLTDIDNLVNDENEFVKRYMKVNDLDYTLLEEK